MIIRQPESLADELGHGVLQLASTVRMQNDLTKSAQLLVETIPKQFKLTANVSLLDEQSAVNIAQSAPSTKFFTPHQYVGRHPPGHAISSGKVLLVFAPHRVQDAVLEAELEEFTSRTTADPSELAQELTFVREQGWAASNNEWNADMTAVAVSLQGANGAIIAAVTITGCTHGRPPESFAKQSRALHTAVRRYGQLLE